VLPGALEQLNVKTNGEIVFSSTTKATIAQILLERGEHLDSLFAEVLQAALSDDTVRMINADKEGNLYVSDMVFRLLCFASVESGRTLRSG